MKVICFLSFILFFALSIQSAVSKDPSAILNSCWPSEYLLKKKGENIFSYRNHIYDTPSPEINNVSISNAGIAKELRGPIRRVKLSTEKKLLALTFDLCELQGEVAGYDGEIVDYLRENKIKATFFSGGKWMRSHPERAQQLMVDPLFEIANHSEAHRNLRLLKDQAIRQEILGPENTYHALRASLQLNQCIREVDPDLSQVPERMRLFRFPFGACNEETLTAANDAGYLIIQWDISTGDPSRKQSAQAIAHAMLKAKPGSIIIAHANGHGYNTAAALRIAIPELKRKGYDFVTVSEILNEGSPEISKSCFDQHAGDTDKYDTFFQKRRRQSLP